MSQYKKALLKIESKIVSAMGSLNKIALELLELKDMAESPNAQLDKRYSALIKRRQKDLLKCAIHAGNDLEDALGEHDNMTQNISVLRLLGIEL